MVQRTTPGYGSSGRTPPRDVVSQETYLEIEREYGDPDQVIKALQNAQGTPTAKEILGSGDIGETDIEEFLSDSQLEQLPASD